MNALELNGVSKIYNGRPVLKNIDLCVAKGEALGLLGPNGAGKTTLLKILSGLTKCAKGSVQIFALDFNKHKKTILRKTGIVPQENNLEKETTVREALLLYARLFSVARPAYAVDASMEKFAMTTWQNTPVRHLSGGMARKALIARALLPEPELLLLDEPSVGLDPDVRREIWQMIKIFKDEGNTVVLTTHYMEEAEALCDRIALLNKGELLFLDTAAGLKKRSPGTTLEDAFIFLTREGCA